MSATSDKLKGKMKKAEGALQEKKGDLEARATAAKARTRVKIDEMRAKRAAKKAAR